MKFKSGGLNLKGSWNNLEDGLLWIHKISKKKKKGGGQVNLPGKGAFEPSRGLEATLVRPEVLWDISSSYTESALFVFMIRGRAHGISPEGSHHSPPSEKAISWICRFGKFRPVPTCHFWANWSRGWWLWNSSNSWMKWSVKTLFHLVSGLAMALKFPWSPWWTLGWTLLVLLDVSVVLDTINHGILRSACWTWEWVAPFCGGCVPSYLTDCKR